MMQCTKRAPFGWMRLGLVVAFGGLLVVCGQWMAPGHGGLGLAATPSKGTPNGRWEVHEWGTFTSMQGSDGRLLEGMHHDEERLPHFVYSREKRGRQVVFKGLSAEAPPLGVTQKLETPVIYFYTDRPRKVKVEVDFPKGVISEWYPAAKKFSPPMSETQQLGWSPKGGSMTWAGQVRPGPATFPHVPLTHLWMPSRQVPKAAPFHTLVSRYRGSVQQSERFIFYRGLGRFRGWFRVASTSKHGVLRLRNLSQNTVSGGIVMNVTAHGGSWRAFGAIAGAKSKDIAAPGPPQHVGVFLRSVKRALVKMLMASGLTRDESWAMVHTWHNSYFRTPGLRVLYIVPRAWTDALLPISITPKPKKLVRTLVGRVEVLTKANEVQLRKHLKQAVALNLTYREFKSGKRKGSWLFPAMGRLMEPKLRRACALSKGKKVQAYCKKMIRKARFDGRIW